MMNRGEDAMEQNEQSKSKKSLFKKWSMRILLAIAILVQAGILVLAYVYVLIPIFGKPASGKLYHAQHTKGGDYVITLDGTEYVYDEYIDVYSDLFPYDYGFVDVGKTFFESDYMDIGFFASDTQRSVLLAWEGNDSFTGLPILHAFTKRGLCPPVPTADTTSALYIASFHDRDTGADAPIKGSSPCTDADVIEEFFYVMSHGADGSGLTSKYSAEIAISRTTPGFDGFHMRCFVYSDGRRFCASFPGDDRYVAIPRELLERIAGGKLP